MGIAGIERNVRNLRDLIGLRLPAGVGIAKRRREYITVNMPGQESEGVIVAMNLGHSPEERRTPANSVFLQEMRRSAWTTIPLRKT